MKITYCVSEHYIGCQGGGAIQIYKTKEYIERLYDIKIELVTKPSEISNDTDLIHLFEISDWYNKEDFIKKAKEINAKIVLSTIYWDLQYFVPYVLIGKIFSYELNPLLIKIEILISKLLSKVFGRPKYFSKSVINATKSIVKNVDLLLPNSYEEGELLLKYCNLYNEEKQKIRPIVNAVEVKNNTSEYSGSLPTNYILQAGRIEPGKNQLNLLKALYRTKYPILFLGKDYAPKSLYSKKLHKLANKRGNVFFIDGVPYEQMNSIYKNAICHVLPSLKESPGLVSLEALYNNCHAVVAEKEFCPCDFYFDDFVTKINPLSKKSILNGIEKELNTSRNFEYIHKIISEKFTWEKTAEQTYMAYKELLK